MSLFQRPWEDAPLASARPDYEAALAALARLEASNAEALLVPGETQPGGPAT